VIKLDEGHRRVNYIVSIASRRAFCQKESWLQ
jgi:hypothetical protein